MFARTDAGTGVFSLAWLTAQAGPHANVQFTWDQVGSFVWAPTGPLRPGMLFDAAQTMPADGVSLAALDERGGELSLGPGTGTPPPAGLLAIQPAGRVPDNTAAIGLAVGTRPLVATQAQPNLTAAFAIPTTYLLAALVDIEPGEVLPAQASADAVAIDFRSLSSWTAIFNADLTWTVQPA